MWLIRAALRRPIATLVVVISVALCSVLAVTRMRIDIFPNLNFPVIYVAQPYGGMSPAQMEGYLVYYYEYHFLYINGIQSVEDKSIQGNGILKLSFYPGTDMSQALAQTISYVNRARSFMPPGTVAPFVIRFDAGTVPVGYIVFSSETRTLGQIQDLALNRVRPAFATLPGVTSPPPFGGNQRTIVVTVNPDRLRSYNMSPDEVVQAINNGNILQPAGNVRTGSLLRIAQSDAVTPNIQTLADLPIRTGAGPYCLSPRHRRNPGQHGHPHRIRAGERPPRGLHPRYQASRRVDRYGRERSQEKLAVFPIFGSRRYQGHL